MRKVGLNVTSGKTDCIFQQTVIRKRPGFFSKTKNFQKTMSTVIQKRIGNPLMFNSKTPVVVVWL